jgi:hypothetical protein
MQFSAKVPSLTSRPLWISFGEVLLGDTSVAIRLFTSSIVSVGSSLEVSAQQANKDVVQTCPQQVFLFG